ncbi:hypothetical protein IAT38_000002 [Cryptococcus sp. DSM 104549]
MVAKKAKEAEENDVDMDDHQPLEYILAIDKFDDWVKQCEAESVPPAKGKIFAGDVTMKVFEDVLQYAPEQDAAKAMKVLKRIEAGLFPSRTPNQNATAGSKAFKSQSQPNPPRSGIFRPTPREPPSTPTESVAQAGRGAGGEKSAGGRPPSGSRQAPGGPQTPGGGKGGGAANSGQSTGGQTLSGSQQLAQKPQVTPGGRRSAGGNTPSGSQQLAQTPQVTPGGRSSAGGNTPSGSQPQPPKPQATPGGARLTRGSGPSPLRQQQPANSQVAHGDRRSVGGDTPTNSQQPAQKLGDARRGNVGERHHSQQPTADPAISRTLEIANAKVRQAW